MPSSPEIPKLSAPWNERKHVPKERERVKSVDPIETEIAEKTKVVETKNIVRIASTGPEAFQALEKEIKKAKSIQINIFSWAPDSTGNRMADLLIDAKKKGVEIILQVDSLGSLFVGGKDGIKWQSHVIAPQLYMQLDWYVKNGKITSEDVQAFWRIQQDPTSIYKLAADKIKILEEIIQNIATDELLFKVNPVLKRMKDEGIDLRISHNPLSQMDHSKIFLFDYTTLYSGGMNVGDDYSGGYDKKEGWSGKIKADYWKDYMLSFRGPGTQKVRETYFGSEKGPQFEYREAKMADGMYVLNNRQGVVQNAENFGPEKQITAATYTLLRKAEKEIQIEHAYMMDPTIIKLLKEAAAPPRNVQVTILRSQPESDSIEKANDTFFDQLENVPHITIVPARKILHTKLLCVDGKYSIIGSGNLTTDSLQSLRETSFFFANNDAQRRLQKKFEDSLVDAMGKSFDAPGSGEGNPEQESNILALFEEGKNYVDLDPVKISVDGKEHEVQFLSGGISIDGHVYKCIAVGASPFGGDVTLSLYTALRQGETMSLTLGAFGKKKTKEGNAGMIMEIFRELLAKGEYYRESKEGVIRIS